MLSGSYVLMLVLGDHVVTLLGNEEIRLLGDSFVLLGYEDIRLFGD